MPGGRDRLEWSAAAERDIRAIWTYYATEASAEVANNILRQIEATADRLCEHPFSGRPRDELKFGLRAVLSRPYVIFYRVDDARVRIVRVLHERRNLLAALTPQD